ncbi:MULTISPECIES: hypothetical protein [unclassified Microcystis]|jgi:cell division protein FtsB|uniref:hypothetical protein n=1 Tax=unclassified Microcystis TaxID=2643300 RepID=UPI00258AFA25|nr:MULTISPECIES: hypothetical protein [unclassified Microcystis]
MQYNKGHLFLLKFRAKLMVLKDGLSDDEFKKLIERLSYRKQYNQEVVTLDTVKESLQELGLSDLLMDNDIEEVRKQVNKEFKKQQRKNYLIFACVLLALTAPLSAFGGYKLKELVSSFSQQSSNPDLVNLSEESKRLELENEDLQRKIKELEDENESLKSSNIPSPSASVASDNKTVSEPSSSKAINVVKVQSLIFEFKECKKSEISSTLQNIKCSFLVTSTQEKNKLYVHGNYNSNIRTRMLEDGKELIATKVDFGSNSGGSQAENILIKDTPIEVILTFEDVPQSIKKVGVIEISSYLESPDFNDYIKAEFHNQTLSNSQ